MAKDALTPPEQTLFAELIQQVETAAPAGTVYTGGRGRIQYYYAKLPVGVGRIDRFVGKAGDAEAEAKVADLKRGMEQAGERMGELDAGAAPLQLPCRSFGHARSCNPRPGGDAVA